MENLEVVNERNLKFFHFSLAVFSSFSFQKSDISSNSIFDDFLVEETMLENKHFITEKRQSCDIYFHFVLSRKFCHHLCCLESSSRRFWFWNAETGNWRGKELYSIFWRKTVFYFYEFNFSEVFIFPSLKTKGLTRMHFSMEFHCFTAKMHSIQTPAWNYFSHSSFCFSKFPRKMFCRFPENVYHFYSKNC